MSRRVAVALLATATLILCAASQSVTAATLIGNPYINGHQNWVDADQLPWRRLAPESNLQHDHGDVGPYSHWE